MSLLTIDTIISLCKRRGFIYPSSDIYGGLNGVYDTGHLGSLLKENIRREWKKSLTNTGKDILFFDGSLLGTETMWKASGHVDSFHDPMVDCTICKKRYRADDIDLQKACPHCGKKAWTDIRNFNMMFQTNLGASSDSSHIAYLRPETAQSIFVNIKNIMTTNRVRIPFGVAQIGKAFRNEITPKQFLFRMREFEQMELEWFCKPEDASQWCEYWLKKRKEFYKVIGISSDNIRIREHKKDELAHYSKNCSDVEYRFPFGWKELEGIANRSDFDIKQHSDHSGKDLSVHDEKEKKSYVPHVIESSVGVDRLFLTLLFDAYKEELINNDKRILLSFSPLMAPIKAAFLPLSSKLSEKLKPVYKTLLNQGYSVVFDDSGSIGKRYRRQDEIGTPICFTYDFDSENDNCVTVRNRDTLKQERISIDALNLYMRDLLNVN